MSSLPNGSTISGSPNWLPGQVDSVPPGVTILISVDVSLAFGSTTGTALDAILAGLKAAVVAAVNGFAGSTLPVSAIATAAGGAPGILAILGVQFNGDPMVTSVSAPTTCEAQYVRVSVRTIT